MTNEEIRDRFTQKLISDYKDCLEEWLVMTPYALIDYADVISATQLIRNNVENIATPDDMEYFLRFEHPLYVIRDSWFENYGADNFCTDEIRHTLWELTDKREAETAYELDDDYLQEARNDQTMSM